MKVTPAAAAAVLRRKAQEIRRRVRTAEEDSGQEALQIARAYSSGPYSTAQLRMLGHPYARRAPRPPGKPSVINKQTGAFRAAWRVVKTGTQIRVVNDSRLAPLFSRGTRYMIRRPVARAVAQAIRQSRERRLRTAIRRGLEAS
jgi:hypothetical protein